MTMTETRASGIGRSFHHPCTYGAERVDGQWARFRLWAPSATSVDLMLDRRILPMQREDDGSYRLVTEVEPGAPYRYRIDGELEVPDPASRAQQSDIDGPSLLVDPSAYHWQHPRWSGRPWHEAVICELHVGTMGGFDAVRAQLPRLRDVGYSVIELMPIAEFPGARNWGYDGVLSYAPDASYGSPDALKALIDEAHGLGLMVMLDVVYNHFGPDGNYLPHYAKAFFRQDRLTPWGPSIDFRQRQVQRFFLDNALMWLNEYRFDGLRLDAVHTIEPETFLHQLSAEVRDACEPGRHVHLVLENEHNAVHLLRDDFQAQWNDDGHNALHVLLTGEHEGYYADYVDNPTAKIARVLGEGFAFQGQLDRRGTPRGAPSAELSPTSFVLFVQNHDQIGNRPMGERLISLIDEAAMRVATALVALCPMVPLFFMGDEWGCRTPFLFFTSHKHDLAQQVRDGRRAEFAHFSGFNDPAKREAIPDPNAESTFQASIPQLSDSSDGAHWQRWFAHLLQLRRDRVTPYLDGCRALGCQVLDKGALLASWQLSNGQLLQIAVNFSARQIPLNAPQMDLFQEGEAIYACPDGATSWSTRGLLSPRSLVAVVRAGTL